MQNLKISYNQWMLLQLIKKGNVSQSHVAVDNTMNRAPADASIDPTEPEKEEEDEDDESDESDYDEDISTIQNRSKNTHLIDMWLKPKTHYCLQLEQVSFI